MRGPDGTEYPSKGVFVEIVKPERLLFTDAFDEGFQPRAESLMTAVVTFEEHAGKTKLTARARHKSVADRDKHEQMGFTKGWGEMLERLLTLPHRADGHRDRPRARRRRAGERLPQLAGMVAVGQARAGHEAHGHDDRRRLRERTGGDGISGGEAVMRYVDA